MHLVVMTIQKVRRLSLFPKECCLSGQRTHSVWYPVGVPIVPDTVFLAALGVEVVKVVGFPNAHGTTLTSPFGREAYDYALTEVLVTGDINDLWYETTHSFIRAALEAQGMTPPDRLLFEAGVVDETTVADVLGAWRREEEGPVKYPLFRDITGGTGVPGLEQVSAKLMELGADVVARLISKKQMRLQDQGQRTVSVQLEDFRVVDYDFHTGNIHCDKATSDRGWDHKDWEQMQLLVKQGDEVGLNFCCPALQRNLHLRANKGLAVCMSEGLLEVLGHSAAAGSASRTLVFNGRVPFALHSSLRCFVRDVFKCQVGSAVLDGVSKRADSHNIPGIGAKPATETSVARPASATADKPCPHGTRPKWVCVAGGLLTRGKTKNPELAEYAAYADQAPIIEIRCAIGANESILLRQRPVGDSRHFVNTGNTTAFLKCGLQALSNFTGDTTDIRSQLSQELLAAAKKKGKAWSKNDKSYIRLLKSDGKQATIRDFAHPDRWEGLRLRSDGVLWDKNVVFALPGTKRVVVSVDQVTVNVRWSSGEEKDVQKKHAKKKLPAGGHQDIHGGGGAEAPAKRSRLSDGLQTPIPAPAPGSPLVPPSRPGGAPTRRHSTGADNRPPETWHIAKRRERLMTQSCDESDDGEELRNLRRQVEELKLAKAGWRIAKRRKHLMTQDSDESDDGEELRNLRWQVEELKLAKAGWRQCSEERAEARQQLLIQVQALRLELSNVKTELESAHRKAAAEGSVRQKETEDAKEAQLEGAKRIRELEEKLHDEVERLKKELTAASSKATILKSYHSTS
jgi:hypothetical protein